MYEDEAIKNKKDIVLDLSDTEATAKICKALSSETRLEILKCLVDKSMTISELAEAFYLPMSSMCLHIKTLSEANLITVVPKPGLRGSQKLCGIKTANVTLDIFAHLNKLTRKPPVYVNMPIGHYSDCHILPPCGIASAASYVYYEDSPYGFYSPDRTDAALIWLTSGFLEYQFSNYPLQQDKVTQIEFSFEICSEAPGYNNNWPSEWQKDHNLPYQRGLRRQKRHLQSELVERIQHAIRRIQKDLHHPSGLLCGQPENIG